MSQPAASSGAVDATTAQVFQLDSFLDHLRPLSPLGRQVIRSLSTSPFLPPSRWRQEITALKALDLALQARLRDDDPFRPDDLQSLPTLERPLRRLRAHENLGDADLFEVKQLLYFGRQLLLHARGLGDLPSPDSPREKWLQQLLTILHPGGLSTPRFSLVDALAPALTHARKAHQQARDAFLQCRQEVENDVLQNTPGRFDLKGRFFPDNPASLDLPTAGLIERDGGLYPADADLIKAANLLTATEIELHRQEDIQRARLSDTLRNELPRILDFRQELLRFDLRLARVHLRQQFQGTWPEVRSPDKNSTPSLSLRNARHPILLDTLGPDRVQPLDVDLTHPATLVLGPNMGGKTALLKTIGLFQWCAQMALPVVADRFTTSYVERLVYIGADEPGQVHETGLSSFGREVTRFVDYWDAEGQTFWFLDEPARGTHPEEGAHHARTIIDARKRRGDRLLVATHFPELASASNLGRLQIRGLQATSTELEALLSDRNDPRPLVERLQSLMDYGVDAVSLGEVPRDAARIARALGLKIDL